MKINNRLNKIGEYGFKNLSDIKKELELQGKEVIDLSIGEPDLKVDDSINDELIKAIKLNVYNKYPDYDGIFKLKNSIIKYYEEVFSVKLAVENVLILIGSKEGISKIIPTVCNFGDYALIPQPAYPVYLNACHLWGVTPYTIPLKESKSYLPHIENIPNKILSKSKLFIINYPNNPTGAEANASFYNDIINLCNKNDIVLCNDSAYNEIIQENKSPISLLQYDRKQTCVEFGSFSKTYNMAGFRIGYVVGNAKVLKHLLKVKSNLDSSQFEPIQYAAVQALNLGRDYVNSIRRIYDYRRTKSKELLNRYNIEYFDSNASFYLWCKTPKNYTTLEYTDELLRRCGIIVSPGCIFGSLSNDYFRISLTKDTKKILKALNNLKYMK